MKIKLLIFLSVLVLLVGCAAGNQPSTSDKTQAPESTTSQGASSGVEHNITMELSKFAFDPNIIEVNQGDVIHLTLTSKDTTHGFSIDAYNVNMTVNGGETQTVTIQADQKGTFEFYCSVPCGSGHSDMNGKLIVK